MARSLNKETYLIEFDGKNANFKKVNRDTMQALGKTESKVKSSTTRMGTAFNSLKKHIMNMPLAIAGISTAIGYAVKKQIDYAESLDKMSQRVGITVENLSTLKHAAELSGASLETLEKSAQRLSRNMLDSALGRGEAKEAFKQLGIQVKKSDGELKNTDQVLLEVAERFSGLTDGSAKTALAMQLFGKSGAELIPMLNQGRDGIEKMQEEARKLGIEVSTNTAVQAARLKDNFDKLQKIFTGFALVLTEKILPVLSDLTDSLVDSSKAAEPVVKWGQVIDVIFKGLASSFYVVKGVLTHIGTLIGSIGAALAHLINLDFAEAGNAISIGFDKIVENGENTYDALKNIWAKNDELLKASTQTNTEQNQKAVVKFWSKLPEIQSKGYTQLETQAVSHEGKLLNVIMQGVQMKMDAAVMYANFISQLNNEIAEDEQKSLEMRLSYTADALGGMANLMDAFYQASGQQSAALFALHKGFAIAEATVSTYLAANNALASVPYPFNFVAAAAVIANGLANVTNILAAKPGGAPTTGGNYGAPSVGSNYQYNSSTNNTNNNQRQEINNYYMIGNSAAVSEKEFINKFVPMINKAKKEGRIN